MNFFNEIGKAASYAANAVGEAAKNIDVEAIGNEIGKAANSVGDTAKKIDPTAIGAAATGGVAGAGLSAVVGGMGLAVGGTAVAIGMLPVAALGAVVGLGAYGVSKAIAPEEENKDI